MKVFLGIGCFIFSLTGLAAHAQDPAKLKTAPNAEQISQWLRSDDPRLEAWGAVYVLQTRNAGLLPLVLDWVENNMPAPDEWGKPYPNPPDKLQKELAMDASLDTLIQMNASVPPQVLQRLASGYDPFPAQVTVLLAHLPYPASLQTLLELASDDHSPLQYEAVLMMAQHPVPAFVSMLFNSIHVNGLIHVVDPVGRPHGFMQGGSGLAVPSRNQQNTPEGWPPVPVYAVRTGDAKGPEVWTLLLPGKWPLYMHRGMRTQSDNGDGTDCSNTFCMSRGPGDQWKLDVIADMLGSQPEDLPIQIDATRSVEFHSVAQYNGEADKFIRDQLDAFAKVDQMLLDKGLVTVTGTGPQLSIVVYDSRCHPGPEVGASVSGLPGLTWFVRKQPAFPCL